MFYIYQLYLTPIWLITSGLLPTIPKICLPIWISVWTVSEINSWMDCFKKYIKKDPGRRVSKSGSLPQSHFNQLINVQPPYFLGQSLWTNHDPTSKSSHFPQTPKRFFVVKTHCHVYIIFEERSRSLDTSFCYSNTCFWCPDTIFWYPDILRGYLISQGYYSLPLALAVQQKIKNLDYSCSVVPRFHISGGV